MTKRQRYLNALNNKKTDELVWAPNFDYWFDYNRSAGRLPDKYTGMDRNDIVRAIDGYIWNRAWGLKAVYDDSVRETYTETETKIIHEFQTPVGTIQEASLQTEDKHSSKFLSEHFVKNLDDLKVLKYVIEACHYEFDHEPTLKALQETGDDGVVLSSYFSVPFIQFCKLDAGYITGYYLWTDHRKEVDSLLQAYSKNYQQGYTVLADGPADVMATVDNMDGSMLSPDIFKEYAIPFYQEVHKITSAKGKIFEGHWCGKTQTLLPLAGDCGLDVLEAIVSRPMADIELSEALDQIDGKVVLQGGIPAVLVCEEGCTYDEFVSYMEEVILPLKDRPAFILGMSDNVPPNADFSRIELIAEMLK